MTGFSRNHVGSSSSKVNRLFTYTGNTLKKNPGGQLRQYRSGINKTAFRKSDFSSCNGSILPKERRTPFSSFFISCVAICTAGGIIIKDKIKLDYIINMHTYFCRFVCKLFLFSNELLVMCSVPIFSSDITTMLKLYL